MTYKCRFRGTISEQPRTSTAPDLHLLFASKVFAVVGRFMARHVGMFLPQGEIVVVATEAVAASRPLASGIKWDFTGARTATALRRIPRWRKRQLRNAKPPPCTASRESTSWRFSIGDRKNISWDRDKRSERSQKRDSAEQMTSNNLPTSSYSSSVKDDNEYGFFIGGPPIQNPKSVKDRLTQEQSSRGIARNRKWRRKADKGRSNRKPLLFIYDTANRQRLAAMSPVGKRREHDVLVDDGKCISNVNRDPQANYPTIMLALNVQDRTIRVTLFIPRFRTR
ncbi:hypothetical protein ALC62_13692 [Cyphomyrmex costatus]|uniref:Uncharacterized protein n=1 Tax=Cyphomyrmex costatus TaxID=456900 RepID=A0A195C3Z2_9HYME|nr:hypothetical protein ALC62_13692 [Cyphomyrmex costatus]